MNSYDTLLEALNDLQKRGYIYDFNLEAKEMNGKKKKPYFKPSSLEVIETHRFEGMSSTDDSSVLYVIETEKGLKGTLVDAYGIYADAISTEMIKKLHFRR